MQLIEVPRQKKNSTSVKRPTIGIFVGKLSDQYDSLLWNGYLDGIDDSAVNTISFICTGLTDAGTAKNFELTCQHLINVQKLDGLVVQTGVLLARFSVDTVSELLSQYRAALPVVGMSIHLQGEPHVVIDNYNSMAALVEHLIVEHSLRRIAFVRGPVTHEEAEVRFQAYVDTLAKYGIALDPSLISVGDFLITGGEQAVQQFFDRDSLSIDAIVAANDTMAKAVINELRVRGYMVPNDVVVVGFDNVVDAPYISPPLTTVYQPVREQAKVAVQQMVQYLEHGTCEQKITLPTKLVVRASCGCRDNHKPLYATSENEEWMMAMAQTVPRLEVNGRQIMQSLSMEQLAATVHRIICELRLAFCYVLHWADSADMSHAKLLFGSDHDGLIFDPQSAEIFPTKELLPASFWEKHAQFNMIIEPLHFEETMLGYIVFDGKLREAWVYESLRSQISNMLKTLALLEQEQSYTSKLEQEVATRTAELEALLYERSQWLRIAAHDLRNPLSVIRVTAGMIGLQKDGFSPQKLAERLDRINKSVDTMNGIIGRLLTIGRIEADQIALAPSRCDVAQLVREVVNHQAAYARHKNITIDLQIAQKLEGTLDGELFMQIVTNLLTNAIKYSPMGTTVTVRLFSVQQAACVSITDEGLGFTQEDQSNLYKQYTRLSAKPTQGEQSIGLGLFIVNKLVDTMGGAISLYSAGKNLGSTFTVNLPLRTE